MVVRRTRRDAAGCVNTDPTLDQTGHNNPVAATGVTGVQRDGTPKPPAVMLTTTAPVGLYWPDLGRPRRASFWRSPLEVKSTRRRFRGNGSGRAEFRRSPECRAVRTPPQRPVHPYERTAASVRLLFLPAWLSRIAPHLTSRDHRPTRAAQPIAQAVGASTTVRQSCSGQRQARCSATTISTPVARSRSFAVRASTRRPSMAALGLARASSSSCRASTQLRPPR